MFDKYRLDVDEAMAIRRDMQTWRRIETALTQGGPFADMLIKFRQDAVTALSDIVYADPNDAVRMAALQAEIRRCLDTMEHIDAFQNAAEAADANLEADGSDEDDLTPPEVEQ